MWHRLPGWRGVSDSRRSPAAVTKGLRGCQLRLSTTIPDRAGYRVLGLMMRRHTTMADCVQVDDVRTSVRHHERRNVLGRVVLGSRLDVVEGRRLWWIGVVSGAGGARAHGDGQPFKSGIKA